jgi:citrate lyase synthetase
MQFYPLKKLTFGFYVQRETQKTVTCYCEMRNFIYRNNMAYVLQLVTMMYVTLLHGFSKECSGNRTFFYLGSSQCE